MLKMRMWARRIFYFGVLLCGVVSNAVLADMDFEPGIDIQLERAHQEFSSDSANVTTVDLVPHLQVGNWDFSLDAPWISADANYVNNQFPTRIVNACDKAASLAQQYPRVKRFANALAKCQNHGVVSSSDTVSGMSDITAFAHYGILLDEQGIWLLSVAAGYKFDNGDIEENLGSGTENTLLEATLGATYGKFSGSLTTGYAMVNGGDDLTESHYQYSALDLGVSPVAWMTLGCTVNYDQSYYVLSDDVTMVTAYLKFKPWQHVRIKIYGRDFGGAEGYPEREYGGSFSLVY